MSGSSRFSRGIVVWFATLGIGLANPGGWTFYIGTSILPVRFLVPPEIALLQVSLAH